MDVKIYCTVLHSLSPICQLTSEDIKHQLIIIILQSSGAAWKSRWPSWALWSLWSLDVKQHWIWTSPPPPPHPPTPTPLPLTLLWITTGAEITIFSAENPQLSNFLSFNSYLAPRTLYSVTDRALNIHLRDVVWHPAFFFLVVVIVRFIRFELYKICVSACGTNIDHKINASGLLSLAESSLGRNWNRLYIPPPPPPTPHFHARAVCMLVLHYLHPRAICVQVLHHLHRRAVCVQVLHHLHPRTVCVQVLHHLHPRAGGLFCGHAHHLPAHTRPDACGVRDGGYDADDHVQADAGSLRRGRAVPGPPAVAGHPALRPLRPADLQPHAQCSHRPHVQHLLHRVAEQGIYDYSLDHALVVLMSNTCSVASQNRVTMTTVSIMPSSSSCPTPALSRRRTG